MEHPTSPWSGLGLGLGLGARVRARVRARAGTSGTSYDIPRWTKMGWTRETKGIPDLGLVGCLMGSQDILRQSRTTLILLSRMRSHIAIHHTLHNIVHDVVSFDIKCFSLIKYCLQCSLHSNKQNCPSQH